MDTINRNKPSGAELSILAIPALVVIIALLVAVSWGFNLYKLTQCDFQAPWKGEIIHAVGLIPVAAPVTVWNNDK